MTISLCAQKPNSLKKRKRREIGQASSATTPRGAAKHCIEQIARFRPDIMALVYEALTPDVRGEINDCYPSIGTDYEKRKALKMLDACDIPDAVPVSQVQVVKHQPHAGGIGMPPDTHGGDVIAELKTVLAKRAAVT